MLYIYIYIYREREREYVMLYHVKLEYALRPGELKQMFVYEYSNAATSYTYRNIETNKTD